MQVSVAYGMKFVMLPPQTATRRLARSNNSGGLVIASVMQLMACLRLAHLGEILVDHLFDQPIQADAVAPAELFSGLGGIADEPLHFGRPEVARIDFDQHAVGPGFDSLLVDADTAPFDPTADAMNGNAGAINFSKISGERTRFNFTAAYKSPGFDVNDLGFMPRADVIGSNAWVQMRWEKPGRFVRTKNVNFNHWMSHNFDGDLISLGWNINSHWSFQNNWNGGFGVNANPRTFDDRRTRGGPGGDGNNSYSAWQYMSTDGRKPVRAGFEWSLGTDGHGDRWGLYPSVTLKPTAALSTEFGISLNRNIEDAQWIGNIERDGRTRFVFGRLYQTTTSMTTRVNYTLTPNLSLQVYAQPFVSAGDYGDFRELINGRATHYANRYAAFAYGANPDFRFLSFRTTNVMRWEFKPGSTLFVVWQQGRENVLPDGSFRFGRDYGDVFSTPSTNTVLVKLAYWLNP